MSAPTLKVTRHFRNRLLELLARREFLHGIGPVELARRDGIEPREVRPRIKEERRLKGELADPDLFKLAMPKKNLIAVLERLRDEAERALAEGRHPAEPNEPEDERHERFAGGAYVCALLLEELGVQVEKKETAEEETS